MEIECLTNLKSRYDQVIKRMTNAGLRCTKFRRNLFTLLFDSEPYALSVEEIRTHPVTQQPDAVTVYRNVEVLTRVGLLNCVTDEKGRVRYRLKENDGPKLTIACRDCHATLVRSSPIIPELESVARDLGYSELNSRLEITGYCEECAEKRSS